MREKLTKRNIDGLIPSDKRYTAFDLDLAGFALRVSPDGAKSYAVKYRAAGVQRWLTIGRHGSPWTPESARKEALRILSEAAQGRDPAAKKAADRRALTFAELCDIYIAEGTAHKKPSSLVSDRTRIELHLKPTIGRLRVDLLTRADIERMQVAVAKGKTATAKRRPRGGKLVSGGPGAAAQCVILAAIVLQFAVDRGLRLDNPARGVKKHPIRKMQRFLSEVEMARLGEALAAEERSSGNPVAVGAIRLLALTGMRRGEVEQLLWRNVDIEHGLLALDDSKTREKCVYLSPPALMLLSRLPRLDNDLVFPGRLSGRRCRAVGVVWERVRKAADLPGVRLHDLRHSFASTGASASFGLPIIGKLLGHTQAATTLRYAHLSADPLRAANDAIGGKIAASMAGAKGGEVVPIRGGQRGAP
jgi:integrase